MDELSANGVASWEIGYVREGTNKAILENMQILEV